MRLLTLAAIAALAGGAWHYRQSHLRRRARRATDNELGRRLKAAIEGSVAEPSKVRVLVKGTRVTLRGTVRREERDFVLAAALGAPGVTTVNNLLNVLDEGSDLGPMQAGFATGP